MVRWWLASYWRLWPSEAARQRKLTNERASERNDTGLVLGVIGLMQRLYYLVLAWSILLVDSSWLAAYRVIRCVVKT